MNHANGTRTVFGYDARGLIGSVWHKNAGGHTLSYRDYWRDDRDRITAWRKSLDDSVNSMENGRGDRYGYDEAGQLTLASYETSNPNGNAPDPERMDVFNYDALGNRMQDDHLASRGWMNFTRDDNGLNQYTGWWPYNFIKYDDDIGNGWGAPHGANGVLMQDGWITAGYNALNQPKMISSQAYNGTSNWMRFGFDPLGRCVKRWVSSSGDPETTSATFYYYDGWNLLQEGAGGANAQRLYIHGARVDEIVKSFNYATGQSAYHHYDARGHCIMLTDPNGGIIEQYDYDAFGFPRFYDATGNSLMVHDVPSNTERGISPYGNRFLFTGREWLTDLKLYDYRNRLYQPELGRFLQPDPKQFQAGDYNIYRYCHNDPINKTDPMGLAPEWLHVTLDGIGTLEPTPFADLTNAVLYGTEGNWKYAAVSIAGVVPYVGDIGKGGKYVGKGVKALQAARAAHRTKTDRLLEHVTPSDLSGAAKELATGVEQGGKHLQEVTEAVRGLRERIKDINQGLSNPRLSDAERKALENELGKASRGLDAGERALKR